MARILLIVGGSVLALVGLIVGWLVWPVSGYGAIPDGMTSERFDIAVRGAKLVQSAGCLHCHWDNDNGGKPFAGGRAIPSSIGTFYSPNITPDLETGIGKWTDDDFVAAFKHGRRPDGSNLFPAFPYTSYAKMPIEDILAIKAYLTKAVRPVKRANRDHELNFPFGLRPLLTAWKLLYLDASPLVRNPDFNDSYHRGQYFVEVLGHCGECHTPRDWLGGPIKSQALGGTALGPFGRPVPNITTHVETGIGAWTLNEMMFFLRNGIKPNYDNAQAPMDAVIKYQTKSLSDSELFDVVNYLRTLDEVSNAAAASDVSPAPATAPQEPANSDSTVVPLRPAEPPPATEPTPMEPTPAPTPPTP